jgi:hypothetical protein
MIRHSALATVLAAASVATAAAQAPAPVIQARVRLLAFTPELKTPEAYAHDPTAAADIPGVKIEIKSYLNDESYLVPTRSKKVVFTSKPDHASMGRQGELIGEASLPTTGNSAIMVFLPGKPGDKAANLVMAVDDSKRSFPPGSFHITNISPQVVRLKLEKSQYDFTPGKTLLISDPPIGEHHQSGMEAFVQKGNAWSPIASGFWPIPKTGRNLALIYQNPATGRVSLRGFDDVTPTDAEAPGATSAPTTSATPLKP